MMENMDRSLYEKRKNLICELVNDKFYVPMKEKELAAFMQVRPEEREELKTILNELLMEGRLQISKRGKYSKGEEGGDLVGTFISHPKGFGFVEIEGRSEDLYIPESGVNGAFHQDQVQVELLKGQGGRRQEARIEKFKQANREANATWLALLIVIVFWCVAGFGLADVKVEFFQTPLWVWAGCIGTWLFAIVVSVVLANCIFKDMDLDDKEDEING